MAVRTPPLETYVTVLVTYVTVNVTYVTVLVTYVTVSVTYVTVLVTYVTVSGWLPIYILITPRVSNRAILKYKIIKVGSPDENLRISLVQNFVPGYGLFYG
jgi:hypothetical protein